MTVSAEQDIEFSVAIYADGSEAPEGTAYVDILGHLEEGSEFYNAAAYGSPYFYGLDGKAMQSDSIDQNSGIALYDSEGFMSLSQHYSNFKSLEIYKDENGNITEYFSLKWVPEDTKKRDDYTALGMYHKCGRYRIAYIDKDGNVLSVTDTAVSNITDSEVNFIRVAGNTAEYSFHSESVGNRMAGMSMLITVMFFIIIIGLGVIIVRNAVHIFRISKKR